MANQWLRLWHDMPNDPKWRTISRISGQSIALVQAVYIHLLTSASQNVTRGHADVTNEDLASHFDVTERDIDSVISAMQGRVLDGSYLTGWERRQPKREDIGNEETGAKSAAQRKREQRDRQREKASGAGDAQTCHDASRNVTTDKEEIREDLKDKTPHNARENFSTPSPKAVNAIIDNHVPPSAGAMVDGKFTMFEGWQPSAEFQRKAALWGVRLDKPATPEEIASFASYWQAEGKAFHQSQWEQKLARSLVIVRARKAKEPEAVPHWNSREGWENFI